MNNKKYKVIKNNLSNYSLNSSRGITLISLVITIIVMLILAGVTLSMVIGENGIVESAVQAKKETTVATEREILSMEYFKNYDYKTGNTKYEPTDFEHKEIEGVGVLVKFPDSGNEYIVESEGNINSVETEENEDGSTTVEILDTNDVYITDETTNEFKKLYNKTVYYYKYYTEEDGWSIRFFLGINTLDYKKGILNLKIGERTVQHEIDIAYDSWKFDEEHTVGASKFNSKYILVYTLTGCPESFTDAGLEVWFDLPELYSTDTFTSDHKIIYNLSEVPPVEELFE